MLACSEALSVADASAQLRRTCMVLHWIDRSLANFNLSRGMQGNQTFQPKSCPHASCFSTSIHVHIYIHDNDIPNLNKIPILFIYLLRKQKKKKKNYNCMQDFCLYVIAKLEWIQSKWCHFDWAIRSEKYITIKGFFFWWNMCLFFYF